MTPSTFAARPAVEQAPEPYSRALALNATGVLAEFNAAGILEAADVHVAQRLGDLAGESGQDVLLAVALVSHAARAGAVCLDLTAVAAQPYETDVDLPWPEPTGWLAAVSGSQLTAKRVLRVEGPMVYFDRYWREEVQVCDDLVSRLRQPAPEVDEDRLRQALERMAKKGWEDQMAAAEAAVRGWTTILTGGPGTGKTASVARMLALVADQVEALTGHPARIGLAAPTGKAAHRMQEMVRAESTKPDDPSALPEQDRRRLAGLRAETLHRLLGARGRTARFNHHRGHQLPYDVIVVDEVSMVSLTHMARLFEAVRPTTRLILVGDPGQLASVEAGAVLADLVRGLKEVDDSPVRELTERHRTEGDAAVALDQLADALRSGDAEQALAVLGSGSPAVRLVDPADEASLREVREVVAGHARMVRVAAEAGDAKTALAALDAHRLLCAHRHGPYGVAAWNRQVERHLFELTGVTTYDEWYPGRPILVTANDRGLGLSNGDLGVVCRRPDGALRVMMQLAAIKDFATTRLADVETVYAMTIHKSQGSEAADVTVVLPPVESKLLTRELFYTAVTRARQSVTVVGTEESLRAATKRRVQRASGLAERLARATR